MKKQVITMMVVVAFFATLAVTWIQAQDAGSMSVTIPFDFAVAGKVLPAGDYHLRRSIEGTRSVMELQNNKNSQRFYLPALHPVQAGAIQSDSKLVFNRYGNQYFLSQVWVAGRSAGDELTKTSRERLVERELATTAAKRERIAIAAKSN